MTNLVVQVRDRSLARVGILPDEDLASLTLNPARNDVGTWSIQLPHMVRGESGVWERHRMAAALAQPGAGIIVDLPGGRRFSGPVFAAKFVESTEDVRGSWEFTGVTDNIVLRDRLAFPDPAVTDAQASSISSAYDVRTGKAESILHGFVNANIGPGAQPSRRDTRIVMGVNGARGQTRTKSARFSTLLEVLQSVAATDNLLFDVIQVDGHLEFRTWQPADLTDTVRLDVATDGLDSTSYSYGGPAASSVILMGQGEASDRVIRTRVAEDADELASLYARRIEVVVDARGTEEVAELDARGDEVLVTNGVPITSLEVVPSSIDTDGDGHWEGDVWVVDRPPWWVGDHVTVTVAGSPVKAAVTAVGISVSSDGVFATATVGDISGFDPEKASGARLSSVESRVSSLERNAGSGGGSPTGSVISFAGATAPRGWLICDGSVFDPAQYPDLYDVIGTTYGGTASAPRLPSLAGRVPVGVDNAQTEFATRGKTGGAKTHTLSVNEMPSHDHDFEGQTFSWGGSGSVSLDSNPQAVARASWGNGLYTWQDRDGWADTYARGGGQPHNNLQPYIALLYLIKA
ncbi:tail fiber protein [Microbacterium sp.]|uniref:Gp37-like protein n=1 Tax=Microbacterium sp. TaxID=51671 RepID=UPI003242A72E